MPSPRVSGAVLLVLALAGGVASVIFLPAGGVISVVSALGLALCVAAVALAAVWFSRRSWAPEPAPGWTPVDRARDRERLRRVTRVQGIICVVFGVGLIAVAVVFPTDAGTLRASVIGVLVLVLGVIGLFASRRVAARVEDDAPDTQPDAMPTGWVLVTPRDRGTILLFALPGLALSVVAVWQMTSLLLLIARASTLGLVIAVLALTAAVIGAGAWVSRLLPEVSVDVGAGLVRTGSREVPWSSFTAARLQASSTFVGGPRSLFLVLEGPEKLRAPLLLRRRGDLAMSDEQRRAALAALDGAQIALPRAPEDPKGKFSRSLFPQHVDAAQARELVAHPPRSDQDLPVAGI